MKTLRPGEYVGHALRRRRCSHLTITLTTYQPGLVHPRHVHEHTTLFFSFAGQHRDETRRASFDQPPLSVVYHPTTEPHATNIGSDGLFGLNFELTDGWLESHCHLRRRNLPSECCLLDSPRIRRCGLRVTASAFEPGEAAGAEVETAIMEMLAEFVLHATPTACLPSWLSRAEEFLRANSHVPVRLSDVAAEVGIHPVYCARAFRRATGMTVSGYVRILRALHGVRLALDERQPLAEVALRAGFSDQAHFTRTCSRILGLPPGRLRRVQQELRTGWAGLSRSRNE